MSRYIIAVFQSYQDAKKAVEGVNNDDMSTEITILNKLPKFTDEEASYKLDGIISGVSDVFIGLPVFVNPMSVVGLPPQEKSSNLIESKWEELGIDKNTALKYQKTMNEGKSIVAFKSDDGNHSQLLERIKQYEALEITIHSF